MLLLDTHVALWLVGDHHRIGPKSRNRIRTSPATYFSAISIAEVTIKRLQGRLKTPPTIHQTLLDSGLHSLALTSEHAVTIERFPTLFDHDPFDRLILAQAAGMGWDLLSADQTLLNLGFDWVLDARL